MNVQERTSRDTGLDNIIESMYSEDCGIPHGPTKRKKKKVKETDDPNVKKRTSALFKRAKCDHCSGDGYDDDGSECKKCGGDGWIDNKDVVKEAWGGGGDAEVYAALTKELDEFLKFFGNKAVSDVHADILEIIDNYLGDGGTTPTSTPTAPTAPTAPLSSPARQSQSPHTPSGMSGLGMMP